MASVTSTSMRPHGQNRSRMNGQAISKGKASLGTFMPQAQQPSQSMASSKESTARQRTGQTKYVVRGRQGEMEKGSGVPSYCSNSIVGSQGSKILDCMLAAATPEQQNQLLGEHIYPLIQKLKPSLAAKITRMLLEMEIGESVLLLESPRSFFAKVEEAVQVLKNSETKVLDQDALHPSYFSAEVAVN